MAVEVEGLDVELLRSEIQRTYAAVSGEPDRDFMFPTGRAWAQDLGYPAELFGASRRRPASRSPASQTRSRWGRSVSVRMCWTSAVARAWTRLSPRRWSARPAR